MSSVEEYSRLTMNLFSASQAVIAFLGCPQRLRGASCCFPQAGGAPQLQESGPPSKSLGAAPLIPASLRVAGMGMRRNLSE